MKELMEYREKLLLRLREAAAEFCEACRTPANPHGKTPDGWSAHQIAFHVRDVDREVYGMRIRRTLSEENPLFNNFGPDEWMEAHYNHEEPLEKILSEFQESVKEVTDLLGNAQPGSWSRPSRHESLGRELTLQLWVERSLAHVEEHLGSLITPQKT